MPLPPRCAARRRRDAQLGSAWLAASKAWLEAGGETRLIRSGDHLPMNDIIVEQATDPARPPGTRVPYGVSRRWNPPSAFFGRPTSPRKGAAQGHHPRLPVYVDPLNGVIAPGLETVAFARPTFPMGIRPRVRRRPHGCHHDRVRTRRPLDPDLDVRRVGPNRRMNVQFPRAFVMAGSAEASDSGPEHRMFWRTPIDGYQAEWLHLADVVQGRAEARGQRRSGCRGPPPRHLARGRDW